ncbi:MAG: hypothetical protein ACI8Y7_000168 [Candidatus Woesearchaeota archaeon]|jgi:hypothetical protein
MINPVDTIIQMRQQGLNNNQIVESLQKDGLSSSDIFEAMNLAEQRMQMQTQPMQQPFGSPGPTDMQPQSMLGSQMPPDPQFPPAGGGSGGGLEDDAQIEQLIEAVIEEKWKEIEGKVSKLVDWKDQAQQELEKIQQEIADVKGNFDSLQKAIVGKVGDYDKHLVEVGGQLQAMEKAFGKVLPQFTENINELDRITSNLKKKQ